MEASQNFAESCSDAYNAASECASNINSCDLKKEAQRLDEFNTEREHADQQIDWMNKDLQVIIEEVSANR